jgi:NDP-sugar pyrophosphorylase family protein
MEALILAAGFGKRLKKVTKNFPKPMLEIGDKPLLQINIEILDFLRIERVYVNTYFKSEIVELFIEGNSDLNKKVTLIKENSLLGTAGSVKNLVKLYNPNNLLVMHGDNYFEDDLKFLLKQFTRLPDYFYGVVGYFNTDSPEKYGVFELDSNDTVVGFQEKSIKAKSRFANSAIYIFNSRGLKIFDSLLEDESDISLHAMPKLLGKLKAVELFGYFIDMGSPENLKIARELSAKKCN